MPARVLGLLLSLATISAPVAAQQPNDVGIFLDPAGTVTGAAVLAFVPVQFYVVGFDLMDVGGVDLRIAPPPDLIITGLLLTGVPPICTICPTLPDLQYGTNCVPGGPTVQLIRIDALMITFTSDVTMCIEPTTFSSFDPPTPGYVLCDQATLVPFGLAADGGLHYPDGCVVINPTHDLPIATETVSWGDVKARY